jgi:hypothetical protein
MAPYIPIDNTMLSVGGVPKGEVRIKATTPKELLPAPQVLQINLLPSHQVIQQQQHRLRSKHNSSERGAALGGMIFWMLAGIVDHAGGSVLLFFIMRGKFKASRKIPRFWDNQPVDLGPLQRDTSSR